MIFLRRSSSSLKPSFITPPSFAFTEGSSFIAFSISPEISLRVCIFWFSSRKRRQLKFSSSIFMSGIFNAVSDKDLMSRGVAVLYMTLVISRSISYTPESWSESSSLITDCLQSCSTASRRLIIIAGLISGCSI